MSDIALDIQGVSKKFKTDFWKKPFLALENVSFQVPSKSICGLIGPNGAGKTTTIKILLNFIRANTGTVKIFGQDYRNKKTHEKMGYLPEQAYYYDYLKPVEFLQFYANLFNISKSDSRDRIEYLLKLVGLSEKKDFKLKSFSKGMLQRIGIAQALINDPSLVIFDEPMSGLDPIGRKEVRDIIMQLKEEGKTILFSTHILPDVEHLCDHVVMLVKGKVTASGSVQELIQPNVQSFDVVIDSKTLPEFPTSWRSSMLIQPFHQQTMIRFQRTDEINQQSILSMLQKNNIPLVSFVPYKESLEDILVQNVKKS